jgi:hypothetical protein
MQQNTHIVTRNFRGVALFLVSALNGFVWTTDRANAERFEHNTAVETARRASDWDRTLEPARAVDPNGQIIEPSARPARKGRGKTETFSVFGQIEAVIAEAMIEKYGLYRIPAADIPASVAVNDAGTRARFAVVMPTNLLPEFNRRVAELRA